MNKLFLCACERVHVSLDEHIVLTDCESVPRAHVLWLTNTKYLRLTNLPYPRPESVW